MQIYIKKIPTLLYELKLDKKICIERIMKYDASQPTGKTISHLFVSMNAAAHPML